MELSRMSIDPNKVTWDAPTKKPKESAGGVDPSAVTWDAPEGTEIPMGRSWIDVAREIPENIVSSGQKFLRGAYEFARYPAETLQDLGEALAGATYARVIPREWMADPAKAQEFIDKANAVGGGLKDRYGSVEALKNTIATDPVGFLADVSTLTGIGGLVAPGAVGRAATTVSRYTDPLRLTGILPATEALGSAAMRAGGTALRGAKTNVLMEAAEGRAPEIINALRGQTQIVPGSMPTAGEAASGLGVTRYSALQRSAEDVLPSEYLAREKAQQAARVEYLRRIGGTDPANRFMLDALKNYRSTEGAMLYGQAGGRIVQQDATLTRLMERPSVQKAFDRARQLAAEDGAQFGTVPGLGAPSYTVADMHYVKMGLDDLLKNPERFGLGATEAAKIGKTRDQFLNWLEGKSPEYKVARTTFASRSKPINQSEIGAFLEQKLMGAKGEERPGVFATAVREAPGTIKKATGQPRFEKLSEVLTPGQMRIVNAIQNDLKRQLDYLEQARAATRAGPQAGRAGSELLLDVAGGVTTPNFLNAVMTATNAALRRLAGKIDRKVAMQIATEMLDPQQAALALEQAQARAAKVSAAGKPIRAAGRAAARAATPVIVGTNALTEAENRNALAR